MNDEPQFSNPPMGSMHGSVQPDRPMTVLENHAKELANILNGFERAALQYDNMLSRLRGPQPSTSGVESEKMPAGSTLDRIEQLTQRLNDANNKLNNMADNLSELI